MAGPTVQLEWAFSWHCPRCRRSFFGTFPQPPLPFDDFLEEHEGEVPPELGAQDNDNTFFMVVPGNVQCPMCGVEYDVKLPRGMDELEGLDEEDYNDF